MPSRTRLLHGHARISGLAALLLTASAGALAQSAEAPPQALEAAFRDPPPEARPRVWWHWMNGNITKDGIAKDLAWMKRAGIGGMQNFDANLQTPQIVDKRLVYMTPEWKDAFRFAASEADRLGLELAIASSPGWSETGGPWVPPWDGLKKLVWSETTVVGGKRFRDRLAPLPTVTGAFQGMGVSDVMAMSAPERAPSPVASGEVAVVAYPLAPTADLPAATVRSGDMILDAAALTDADLDSGVDVARRNGAEPGTLVLSYPSAQTIRSVTLLIPEPTATLIGPSVTARLEASDDGARWRKIVDIPIGAVPTTVGFAAATARHFRLVFDPAAPSAFERRTAAPGVAGTDFRTMIRTGLASKPLRITEFRLSPDARIDRFEAKGAFTLEPDYLALSAGVPEAAGYAPARAIDLTTRLGADGTLDWTPPPGRWRIVRFGWSLTGKTNHPAPPEATGLEVDKFDGAAVRRYLEHYLDLYRDASGGLIGARGVRALLNDSTEVGAANWTPRLLDRFRQLRGYDPLAWLPALSGAIVGSRAQSDRFLFDFRRTLADLHASEHYGTVAEVAHEKGLTVYGEALEDHRPSIGDDMALRRHADVPMAAMWFHPRGEAPRATYLADVKGAASVSHVYGQNLVAAESLTSAAWPWAFAPADLRRVIDLEFVTGVNRPVIHTSVHVPTDAKVPGLSLYIFGQYFNRNDTWAEMARPWMDYMARNALLLQQGRNVADVAYFYGEEAPLTALFGDRPVAEAPTRYAYDFVNADALTGALANDGGDLVTPGGARYRAIYLGGSSHRMTLPTLRRLAALVEGGATVIGEKPDGDPGLASDAAGYAALVARLWPGSAQARVGKGRVIAIRDVERALVDIAISPDFRFTGGQPDSDIPFLHRKLADGDSYFLVNRKFWSETIEARFRITGKAPELWHADTGRTEPVSYRIEGGETIVPISLLPEESVHVVFRKPAIAAAMTVPSPALNAPVAVSGAWTVRFQEGRGAPATFEMPVLAGLDTNADQGIKYFSGIATYTSTLTTPRDWRRGRPLWLDLGQVGDLAEVRINGVPVGTAWHAPYRLDIGSAARRGRNTIEVRVANLWVNRLIGDAQPGVKPITFTSVPTYRADAPLRQSGLIGPVTLRTER